MGRDAKMYFNEQLRMQNPNLSVENFVDFIEDGPAQEVDIRLSIEEFDHKLRSSINFTDPECFKALILPLGLEEMRVVVQYEVVNLQLLIMATKSNQILLDNCQRKMCEIEFFEQGFCVANPVMNLFELLQGTNLLDHNLKKLPSIERSAVRA
jgi:hypothetical protein